MGKHYSKNIRRYRIPEKKVIVELSLRELKIIPNMIKTLENSSNKNFYSQYIGIINIL